MHFFIMRIKRAAQAALLLKAERNLAKIALSKTFLVPFATA